MTPDLRVKQKRLEARSARGQLHTHRAQTHQPMSSGTSRRFPKELANARMVQPNASFHSARSVANRSAWPMPTSISVSKQGASDTQRGVPDGESKSHRPDPWQKQAATWTPLCTLSLGLFGSRLDLSPPSVKPLWASVFTHRRATTKPAHSQTTLGRMGRLTIIP